MAGIITSKKTFLLQDGGYGIEISWPTFEPPEEIPRGAMNPNLNAFLSLDLTLYSEYVQNLELECTILALNFGNSIYL